MQLVKKIERLQFKCQIEQIMPTFIFHFFFKRYIYIYIYIYMPRRIREMYIALILKVVKQMEVQNCTYLRRLEEVKYCQQQKQLINALVFLQFLWTVQALEAHNFSESESEKVMKRRIGSKLFITYISRSLPYPQRIMKIYLH